MRRNRFRPLVQMRLEARFGQPGFKTHAAFHRPVQVGETTEDKLFTLEAVNCLGACALGPIVVVNNEYHGNMSVRKTDQLLNELKKEEKKDNN